MATAEDAKGLDRLVGRWHLVGTENFEEYLKKMGLVCVFLKQFYSCYILTFSMSGMCSVFVDNKRPHWVASLPRTGVCRCGLDNAQDDDKCEPRTTMGSARSRRRRTTPEVMHDHLCVHEGAPGDLHVGRRVRRGAHGRFRRQGYFILLSTLAFTHYTHLHAQSFPGELCCIQGRSQGGRENPPPKPKKLL